MFGNVPFISRIKPLTNNLQVCCSPFLFLIRFGRKYTSGGFDTVLVVVDRLTKYAHFLGVKHPFLAVSLFTHKIVKLLSYPLSIVLDRDKVFMSLF